MLYIIPQRSKESPRASVTKAPAPSEEDEPAPAQAPSPPPAPAPAAPQPQLTPEDLAEAENDFEAPQGEY